MAKDLYNFKIFFCTSFPINLYFFDKLNIFIQETEEQWYDSKKNKWYTMNIVLQQALHGIQKRKRRRSISQKSKQPRKKKIPKTRESSKITHIFLSFEIWKNKTFETN